MKKFCAILALILLVPAAYFAWRSVTTPKYGWLKFGLQAKTRLLLRVDGDSVSIDMNRNGRFDAVERIKDFRSRTLSIAVVSEGASYTITKINSYEDAGQRHLLVTVRIKGAAEFDQLGDLSLSSRPAGAATAHFDGPLEVQPQMVFWELPKELALRKGEKGTDLRANLGTFQKTQKCWAAVYTQNGKNSAFPSDVFPWVEVQFPGREGKPPIVVRYPLDKVC